MKLKSVVLCTVITSEFGADLKKLCLFYSILLVLPPGETIPVFNEGPLYTLSRFASLLEAVCLVNLSCENSLQFFV